MRSHYVVVAALASVALRLMGTVISCVLLEMVLSELRHYQSNRHLLTVFSVIDVLGETLEQQQLLPRLLQRYRCGGFDDGSMSFDG